LLQRSVCRMLSERTPQAHRRDEPSRLVHVLIDNTMPQPNDSAAANSSEPTWRIGVLFSRSGVMSVSETEHFLGTVLAIEQINAAGGVLGRQLEPVALDPKSDPDEYRRLADHLLLEEGVSVIFGCSTSSGRKAVLPAIERRNGLLWYCSLYEGFEFSPNVIYTGAAPNQNTLQLAAYLLRHHGKRFHLIGSDYIYPRETNRIMREVVEQHGGEVIDEVYLAYEAATGAVSHAVKAIQKARPDVVFSTLVGRPAREFYRLYRELGSDSAKTPIASLTMVECEVQHVGAELCQGHITAATYFSSLEGDANARFVADMRARFGPDTPVSMWAEGAYSQVLLFARALEITGSLDTQKLVQAAMQVTVDAPAGTLRLDPENQHAWLLPRIARVGAGGAFELLWQAHASIKPDPYLTTDGFARFWLD
jgi:branched-chain amino acid transport system substrate-binding protein